MCVCSTSSSVFLHENTVKYCRCCSTDKVGWHTREQAIGDALGRGFPSKGAKDSETVAAKNAAALSARAGALTGIQGNGLCADCEAECGADAWCSINLGTYPYVWTTPHHVPPYSTARLGSFCSVCTPCVPYFATPSSHTPSRDQVLRCAAFEAVCGAAVIVSKHAVLCTVASLNPNTCAHTRSHTHTCTHTHPCRRDCVHQMLWCAPESRGGRQQSAVVAA